MRVVTTVRELHAARAGLPEPVGLVPTMGALHDGHLALVRAARAACASVVVSVFVNPTQFGPGEDLTAYPRDLERDLTLLAQEGVALLFAPAVAQMYPAGTGGASVDPGPLGDRLEGAARPGHFRGVATIVIKLAAACQPDAAYFGWKDAQQVLVLRAVVRDLLLPVAVRACSTVREPDGLALSSRNAYLTPEERRAAPALHRGLSRARALWAGGERDAEALRRALCRAVDDAPPLALEYASVADPDTLLELETVGERGALLSLAALAGRARLIDNQRIGPWAEEGPE